MKLWRFPAVRNTSRHFSTEFLAALSTLILTVKVSDYEVIITGRSRDTGDDYYCRMLTPSMNRLVTQPDPDEIVVWRLLKSRNWTNTHNSMVAMNPTRAVTQDITHWDYISITAATIRLKHAKRTLYYDSQNCGVNQRLISSVIKWTAAQCACISITPYCTLALPYGHTSVVRSNDSVRWGDLWTGQFKGRV